MRPHRSRHPPKFRQRRPKPQRRRRNIRRMPYSRSSGKSREKSKPKRCPRSNTGSSSMNRISGPSGVTESPFPMLYWKSSMVRIIAAICWKSTRKKTITLTKKCGHKRNLMTVKHLLTRIAKYADEPDKMPQRGSASYQVHLSDGAGDAEWGQVHSGICRARAPGL